MTVPLKPLMAFTATLYVVLFPWVTVCELGVAETVKSGAGGGAGVALAWFELALSPPLLTALTT